MTNKYTYILLVAALLVACSKSDSPSTEVVGQGSVEIATVVATKAVEVSDDEDIFEIPADVIPSQEEFSLYVEGTYIDAESDEKIAYEQSFESIEEFNTYNDGEPAVLWGGNYTATLSDGRDMDTESETNACFASEPTAFTVEVNKFGTATNVNATLQNSIIRLKIVDDWFTEYFDGAEFVVTTSNGNSFTFDPFSADNDTYIVFVAPETEITLSGVASRVSGGSDVEFAESVVGEAKGGYMNTIEIKTSGIGSLIVSAAIDKSIVQIHEESIELNPVD